MELPRRGIRRFVALTVAASIHGLLLLALLSQPSLAPAPQDAIQLELPIALRQPRQAPIRRQPQRTGGPASPAPVATAPAPRPVGPTPSAPSANPSAPPASQASDSLRHALNVAFGCDLPGGPRPEDRARCAERLATAGAPPRSFGIDPAQRAYFDAKAQQALWWQQPVLGAIPKNGCAPLATNQQQAVTGGETTADSRWRALPPSQVWRTGGPSSSHPASEWTSTSDWRAGVGCGKSFFNAMSRH